MQSSKLCLTSKQAEAVRLQMAEHLAGYAVFLWPGFKVAKHHAAIIRKLEAVARGEIKRLMIFMPPRHGKSLICSELFPAWYLGRNPNNYVIFTTYAQEFADDTGRKVRNNVRDERHQWVFPECKLKDDSTSAKRFHVGERGAFFAVGACGPITGRGADLMIIDDPVKNSETVESKTERRKLKDWYTSTAYTRLMPGGAIVIIQTRWHEDDLSGWLLREHEHEGWDVLSLPAIAEEEDAIGRNPGEALWPECYPVEALRKIKLATGSRDWSALYQQRPTAVEGSIFRREWWRYYREIPARFDRVIQSWDTAFKSGQENDYSAGLTVGVTESGYYLLDQRLLKAEYPELKAAIRDWAAKWSPDAVLIEDTAAGQSAIQELKRDSRMPIIPIRADRDKVSRANAVTPTLEAGKVYLPEGSAWASDFVESLAAFPNAQHDDQVDAFTQALGYLVRGGGALGMLDFYRKLANQRTVSLAS